MITYSSRERNGKVMVKMDKEVLFQKMRKDNQKGDERFKQIETRCYANAFYAVNIFGCSFYFLSGFGNMDNTIFRLLFGPVMLGLFVYYVSKFYFLKEKKYLFPIILFFTGVVAFFDMVLRILFLGNS